MRSTIVAAVAGILLATMPITSAHSESVFLVGPTADCNPTFRPTGRVDYACKSNRDILDFERGVQISCTAPISIGWQSKPGAGGFRPIAYAHIEPQCRSRSLQPPISARTNIYASAVPPADRTGSVLWLYSPSPSPKWRSASARSTTTSRAPAAKPSSSDGFHSDVRRLIYGKRQLTVSHDLP
jgi:hypothetical protein